MNIYIYILTCIHRFIYMYTSVYILLQCVQPPVSIASYNSLSRLHMCHIWSISIYTYVYIHLISIYTHLIWVMSYIIGMMSHNVSHITLQFHLITNKYIYTSYMSHVLHRGNDVSQCHNITLLFHLITYTDTYTYAYTYTYTHKRTHTLSRTHTCTHTRTHIHIHVHLRALVNTHT